MEELDSKKSYKLKKFIKALDSIRAPHTELISVYIPQGYDLNKIIQHLGEEQGTASNIKSKVTRTNVIDALERMIRHLRLYKRTPPNGLAVFSGNLAAKEGKKDLKVFSIEPPVPLNTRLYRCDQAFVLDLLKSQLEHHESYGLIVLDRREANLGLLKGNSVIPLSKLTSGVPGKYKTGGQCHPFGTTIQVASGEIIKIEELHNPYILKSMSKTGLIDSPVIDKWNTKKNEIYKITTKFPQLKVESSKDHLFFVQTDDGIIEKPAENLKEGDKLLMPEIIEIEGVTQKISSKKYYNSFIINKQGQELLKQKRLEKGLLQRELAKKINLFQTTISYYEIGRQKADRNSLRRLCEELNINFEEFLEKYTIPSTFKGRSIKLPMILDEEFANFIGYYLGDGSSETDRITFFEQDKEVALAYKNKFDKYFGINSNYKFRETKNYHQIKFTRRALVRLIKNEFPELKKTLDSEVPIKILKSKKEIIANFLRGYFDAEGYVVADSVGIGSNNKLIIQQVQLLLLRFSIISSFQEYDNKRNPYSSNPIFKLQINEKKSLELFKKNIGLTSSKKNKKLDDLINKKSDVCKVRQILTPGSEIRKIIEKAGYNLQQFPKVSGFFSNKRMMSKEIFKNSILANVKDKELYNQLKQIYDYPILPVQIHKIEIENKPTQMVDISVKNHNFIANGLIVHNSAQRFARLREEAAHVFYQRIAEDAKKEFFGKKEIKGILIGGPGSTKEEFYEGDFLVSEIKNKVLGLKDLTYTDEFGLNELVEKSQDILAETALAKEKELLNRFFTKLAKEPEKVTYGLKETKKALEIGAVEILLISETLENIEEIEELAENSGVQTEIVSIETQEGIQLKNLGEIGAILRYPIY